MQLHPAGGVRSERKNPADSRVSEEGGGGGASDARAEIPLQSLRKIMMRQLCPYSPREEQRSTCSPQRSMVGQISSWGLWRIQSRGIPKGGCDPGGSLHRSRLLAELVTPEIALHALCVLLADQSHFCAVSTVCPITRRAAADTTNITGKTKVSCHDCFSTSNTGYSVTVWFPIACHH